ncbi:MAG TPA: iron ABC transporter permease [Bryobacteraceae bacterium]|nr:iron ABC transporter permease [Bryobacteraceae bacterium]
MANTRRVDTITPARFLKVMGVCGLIYVAVLAATPWIGSTHIDLEKVMAGISPDAEIFFQARLPRVLLSALAGGALSVAGVLFQALLRDSLADPYTMGISSGASLGAVLAICFGWRGSSGLPAAWIAALVGAGLALSMVIGLASHGRRVSSFSLLMSGVTVNTMAIAVILLLQSIATFGQSFAINRWLMGSIESVEYSTIAMLAGIVAPLVLYTWRGARSWNLMAAGEEWAATRGVDTTRFLWTGFLAGSLITGSVTVITGPVGFLGLIVPHALRLWFGGDHRLLLPASFLLGGAFLAACDTVARTILAPVDIPVGVITAMLGGPFFLLLLRTRQKRYFL